MKNGGTMRYFFIDLENVRNEGLEGVLSLNSDDVVLIYYSENAMNLSIPTMENLNNSKATKKFIKTNYIGKNAMDFQIVSLFGAMIERNRQGSYYIISQDNGFRSAVSFCESYFEDYNITCGVYPRIISAITDEMKRQQADNRSKNRQQKESSSDAVKASDKASDSSSTVKNQEREYNYIYVILEGLLNVKTIEMFAGKIDRAIGACKDRKELHEFFHNECGEDEGEALYRVTQSDFDALKKARAEEKPFEEKLPAEGTANAKTSSGRNRRKKKKSSKEAVNDIGKEGTSEPKSLGEADRKEERKAQEDRREAGGLKEDRREAVGIKEDRMQDPTTKIGEPTDNSDDGTEEADGMSQTPQAASKKRRRRSNNRKKTQPKEQQADGESAAAAEIPDTPVEPAEEKTEEKTEGSTGEKKPKKRRYYYRRPAGKKE